MWIKQQRGPLRFAFHFLLTAAPLDTRPGWVAMPAAEWVMVKSLQRNLQTAPSAGFRFLRLATTFECSPQSPLCRCSRR
jgi:hypothetical protein